MAAEIRLAPRRQRICRCGMTFYLCRPCDRGQRYCSERCRQKARREQRRVANRRHQDSVEGRLDHRDRQRRYRERLRQVCVTDQSSIGRRSSATMPVQESEPALRQASSEPMLCIRCGRVGLPIPWEANVDNPKQTTQSERQYMRAVLNAYIALPETPLRWHSADREIARELSAAEFRLRSSMQPSCWARRVGSAVIPTELCHRSAVWAIFSRSLRKFWFYRPRRATSSICAGVCHVWPRESA
jgi:hypothetical protein